MGIYKDPNTGYYSYTEAYIGEEHKTSIPNTPAGMENAGSAHTHGADSGSRYNDENHSKNVDKYYVDQDGLPDWLGTPSGDYKRYDPDPNKKQQGKETTLDPRDSPHDENDWDGWPC